MQIHEEKRFKGELKDKIVCGGARGKILRPPDYINEVLIKYYRIYIYTNFILKEENIIIEKKNFLRRIQILVRNKFKRF